MPTLDLDLILSTDLEIVFDGKQYAVKDPGFGAILRTVKTLNDVSENPEKTGDFSNAVRAMAPGIPEEVFNRLSVAQVVALFNAVVTHFMKTGQKEAPAGAPLPTSATNSQH